MIKRIETKRLFLRPLTQRDSEDVFEWVSDPIVNRYMPYSLYQNIHQVEDWIASLNNEENEFAFCLKDTGKVIGAGSITFAPAQNAKEADTQYKNAIDHGATSLLEPTTEPWGQRTCFIAAPEGNVIEIGSWNKPYE